MKTLKITAPFVLVLLLAAKPVSEIISPKSIADNNNLFAFAIYQKIIEREKGNVFFSPFSVSTALAMTYAGANGKTADEMAAVMHFAENTNDFHVAYGNYLQKIEKNADGNIRLNVANRLWAEKKDFTLLPSFIDINNRAYKSSVELLDFRSNAEASRITINKWVSEKTENRINDLIAPGVITPNTRLVLTNAIYFKGNWFEKFDKSLTTPRKFYHADGSTKMSDFMNHRSQFHYFENEQYKMLRLPYKGDKQSMIIVLPQTNVSISVVEKSIKPDIFQNVLFGQKSEVIVALPKFKLTLPLEMSVILQKMGMIQAFGNADFSKMATGTSLSISNVIHKAFIEINEEGTEAAAATAVVMEKSSSAYKEPKFPKEFIADHPFLFYIIDNETEAILFLGRMMSPEK